MKKKKDKCLERERERKKIQQILILRQSKCKRWWHRQDSFIIKKKIQKKPNLFSTCIKNCEKRSILEKAKLLAPSVPEKKFAEISIKNLIKKI
jgi:hypothetical protein